jgi:hypothetical protein
MADYRLYYLDKDGHISRGIDMTFHDDDEAVAYARTAGSEYGLEIWQGAQKVREILPHD